MNPRVLAEEYLDLTDQMAWLKFENQARRVRLQQQYEADLRALRDEERELSARRAQVALRMTQTGRNLDDLGRMVGVSGPFICQLARKAREEKRNSEQVEQERRDGDNGQVHGASTVAAGCGVG